MWIFNVDIGKSKLMNRRTSKHFYCLLTAIFCLFPAMCLAQENSNSSIDLTHHVIGYFAIFLTATAYIAAMTEDVIELRKSKPMVLGSALVWFAICIYYALHGQAKVATAAFESNLLAYIELLLFILVSMTYLNAMKERGIFEGLKIFLNGTVIGNYFGLQVR